MAKIIQSTDKDLQIAASQINLGGLVAFPTETVYGLGAHLEEKSLAQIFATKKRPYSDPLITHFAFSEDTKKYIHLTEEETIIFDKLAKSFWPGPLTIVAPATSLVPPLVMAGTGCVGVRVPSHPVAHRFLELCGEPVAAPSANLFGHVSPTTPEHVFTDLGFAEELLIISGGESDIGIESTVIRLIGSKLTILRPGFITSSQLNQVCPGCVTFETSLKEKLTAPGHEIRHYAPNMPTYLLTSNDENIEGIELTSNSVLIDFKRKYSDYSSKVLRYFDLSPIGSIEDAIHKVYTILREAEQTINANDCIIVDIFDLIPTISEHDQELFTSLRDRLLRSASHQIRKLIN